MKKLSDFKVIHGKKINDETVNKLENVDKQLLESSKDLSDAVKYSKKDSKKLKAQAASATEPLYEE